MSRDNIELRPTLPRGMLTGAMTGLSEEVRRTQAALGGTEDRLQQNTALLEKARGVAEALRVQVKLRAYLVFLFTALQIVA